MSSCDTYYHSFRNAYFKHWIDFGGGEKWASSIFPPERALKMLYRVVSLEIWMGDPSGEYLYIPGNRRPHELYINKYCRSLKWNQGQLHLWKGEQKHPRSHLYPSQQSSTTVKVMEICATVHRDTCPAYEILAVIMINFLGIGGNLVGLWFLTCRSKVRIIC